MTPRSIRRAAERKAAKLARKAERTNTNMTANPTETTNTEIAAPSSVQAEQHPYATVAADAVAAATQFESNLLSSAFDLTKDDDNHQEEDSQTISAARLAANQQNAKLSTGPRTNAGKSRVSMNAIKTGITAQIIVLTATQAPFYQKHVESRFAKYAPVGDDENMLVQAIVDNEWRLAQIVPLEAAVYANGLREFADEFADEQNPVTREALLRGHVYLHYRRDLSNLSLQERRIRNHIEKDVAQLETLQKSRLERRKNQVNYCIKLRERLGAEFQPSDCGFDFSTSELESFLTQTATLYKLTERRGDFDKFLATYRSNQKGAKAA
jgi:hypothetical protein